jgi:hypothetical protein
MANVIRFSELLTQHVNRKIVRCVKDHPNVDPVLLKNIRDIIQDTVSGIFQKSTHKLSYPAMGWLANQYFRSIKLDSTPVDDMIVINDYKMSDMTFNDVQLLRNLFDDTRISSQLNAEFKRRTAS